ncbi:MAG: amidohydrolase family protein [Candidatus Ranarchaeia archaeon]
MIIDMHTSIPPDWLRPKLDQRFAKATDKDLIQRMDALDIGKVVLFSIARDSNDVPRINDHIHELVKKHPDRFLGFMNLYPPDLKQTVDEIGRALDWGFHGLKIHPRVQRFPMNHPGVSEMLDQAKQHGLPVIIHVDAPYPTNYIAPGVHFPAGFPVEYGEFMQAVADLATPYAKAKFLRELPHLDSGLIYAAHLGGAYYKDIQKSNVMFQTPAASIAMIEHCVKAVGAKRVVYGSDYPLLDPAEEIRKIKEATITDNEKQLILGGNVKRLFRL